VLRLALHRLPGAVVLGLAGWTLLAQICTALGFGLIVLECVAAAALVGAMVGWRRGWWSAKSDIASAAAAPFPVRGARDGQRYVLVLLASILVVGAFGLTSSPWVLSLGGAGVVLIGLAVLHRGSVADHEAPLPSSRRDGLVLLLLAVATAALALVAHAPDPDDAFYLNVAVQAAASPHASLLTDDGIFGIEGMPIQLPVYRAHAIELFVGAVAHLTRTEPVLVAHLGMVALAGLLLPLTAARLLRRIVPGREVLGAALVVVVLSACGEGEQGPGHFALLRLHQGKGILLAFALPMVIDAAWAYAHRPSRRRWMRLVAAQVAAVGLTSSALFAAPLVAVLTLVCAWTRGGGRALLAGVMASGYSGLVLAWVGPQMRTTLRALAAVREPTQPTVDLSTLTLRTLEGALGTSTWAAVVLVLALSAWSVPRSMAAARVLGGGVSLALLVFLCPPLGAWIAERLLAPEVYFRTLWIVPWGVLAAVTLLGPFRLFDVASLSPARRALLVAGTLVVAVALPATTSPYSVFSARAGTRLDVPGPKVPPLAYEAARWVATATPAGAHVLAPEEVAPWVSTFRSLTHPLYSRYIYERFLLLELSEEEVYQRRTLTGFVGRRGAHLEHTEVLCHHAAERDLQGIVLRRFGDATVAQGRELAQCGFYRAGQNERFEVWVRTITP
jgi:hypothetical protein